MDGLPLNVPDGVGVGTLLVVLFMMVATGRIATWREIREKDARIAAQAKTITTLEHQLTLVLTEAMTTLSPVLRAMRAAAEADADESEEP